MVYETALILHHLQDFGVDIIEGVTKYVTFVNRNMQADDNDWMVDQLEGDAMMDHNLLLRALSEMDFKCNTIVIPSHESVRMMTTAVKSEICEKDIDTHFERMKRLITVREEAILIIPVTNRRNYYWRIVIADAAEGKIWWGDSANYRPFGKIMTVVERIMMKVHPKNYEVYGKEKKYILKELKYETEEDEFICGFYSQTSINGTSFLE